MNPEISTVDAVSSKLLSVIVPARNEAESIRNCLVSLIQQSEEDFLLGRDWEVFVVDDGSTDSTGAIAREFADVAVMEAPRLPEGWTGKASAVWSAAQNANGKWLLFTDADTVHEPGNLRRAVHEAERYRVAMLSYSPRQIVRGFWERAVMPLVFSDLVQKYPPRLVNLPDSPVAAANGQFLLIERDAYQRIGGHRAVRRTILEDLELARLCKQAHLGLRFRYAPDAVSTRMYRSFGAMCEGWKKNLALLFPDTLTHALGKFFQTVLIFGLPLLAVWMYLIGARVQLIWAVGLWWIWRVGLHLSRVYKAHFSSTDTVLSVIGLPVYTWLLLDSWKGKTFRRPVAWKGRSYPG